MRVTATCLLMLVFAFSVKAYSQSVEVFGYYEPQLMSVYLDDQYSQVFSNKLRVDLQSEIEEVKFAANFDYITYHGRTSWDLEEYIPKSVLYTIDTSLHGSFNYEYNDTIFLDNAYLKFSKSIFDITLGRQQISTGTGYAWNPTDLYNAKDAIDPTYEQPGHSALRLDAALSVDYNAIAIYFPEDDWNNSGKLLRLKGKISHFDYSLIFIEKIWQLSDIESTEPLSGKRRLYGGDFAGELFKLGLWGEFAFNTHDILDDFSELLVGTDYTFDNGLYVMVEYYRNGLGGDDYKNYSFNDWLRFLTGEIRTISQDNLYLYCDYPLNDFIHLSNSFITSLSDQSVAVVPSLNYSMYQNVELNIFLNFIIGEAGKAYDNDQGYSGIARFRVYF